MVIRVWIDIPGSESPGSELRARLTRTLDVAAGQDSAVAVAGEEGVLTEVRRFLDEFVEETGCD